MNVALVTIAKDEDNYINEWIRYNLKLGFSQIFIYQNDWALTKIDSDIDQSRLHLINWPTQYDEHGEILKNPQLKCYQHFIDNFYDKYDWGAFFDCDEFLYMNKCSSLQSLLNAHKTDMSIQIDWRLFGDSFHKCVEDNVFSVIDRFNMSAKHAFGRGKSIINFKLAKNKLHVSHETTPVAPVRIDPSVAEIAHYMCKTWEEFIERRANPKNFFYSTHINQNDLDKLKKFFNQHNKNEVKNTKVYDFYHSLPMISQHVNIYAMRPKNSNQRNGLQDLIDSIDVSGLTMVEIGSYAGESMEMFASSSKFKTVICVDPWENDYDINDTASTKSDMNAVQNAFDARQQKFNNVIKYKGTLEQFVQSELFCQFKNKVDFVYIDANHQYAQCKYDIQICQEHICPMYAYAGHDYASPKHTGVKQAVDELFNGPDKTFIDKSWIKFSRKSK